MHIEEKSVFAERFICNFYLWICDLNVYNDKLTDIINEYNKKYHRTIKMKPLAVNSSPYIGFPIKNDEKCWWSCRNIRI